MADSAWNHGSRLPDALRNWQVIEIEGEASLIEETTDVVADTARGAVDVMETTPVVAKPADAVSSTSATADDAQQEESDHTPTSPTPAQSDSIIIATLAERHHTVDVGVSAVYRLTLLNNGPQEAHFAVHLAESVATGWLVHPIPQAMLRPGERKTVTVELMPPRAPTSPAGDHQLTFIVQAAAYPEHLCQTPATLTIRPYSDLKLGQLRGKQRAFTWWRCTLELTTMLANRGNYPLAVRLQGQDRDALCRFTFHTAAPKAIKGQQRITLQPGRSQPVTVQIESHLLPWLGLRKQLLPIQVIAQGVHTTTTNEQSLKPVMCSSTTQLMVAPVFGAWQITSLITLAFFGLMGVGLIGMVALALFTLGMNRPATPVQNVVAAAPPVVAVIVQSPVTEKLAVPLPAASTTASGQNQRAASTLNNPGEVRDVTAPLVEASQVSAPDGSRLLATQPESQVENASAPAQPATAPRTVTYGAMFQEIALGHDLNWRMLAAQAYVESGFDALALGQHGDLGLMQILPSTWREWAPKENVSDPFDSYSNVQVAAAYLDYLRTALAKQGQTEPQWMLVAYNWGLDKVLQHLAAGNGWDDLPAERQQYATEILRLAETIPASGGF